MVKEEIPVILTFLNHCFPTTPKQLCCKRKYTFMYFQLLKKKIDMLSLENNISDIVPNVSNKQEKIWCKSLQWL